MDTRQLRYFLAVIDHQGLSRAAEHLFIAQPSLSQAIATLERELGVSLFHRTGRRLILSDAGERLVGPARQVLRDLASAQSTIDAVKGLHTGRVEMISMPSPGIEPLSSLMRRLAERYPGIRISVDAAFVPEEVIYAVRSGACEIGLLGAPTAVQSPRPRRDPARRSGTEIGGNDDREVLWVQDAFRAHRVDVRAGEQSSTWGSTTPGRARASAPADRRWPPGARLLTVAQVPLVLHPRAGVRHRDRRRHHRSHHRSHRHRGASGCLGPADVPR